MSVDQLPPGKIRAAQRDAKLVRYEEYIDTQITSTRRLVKAVDITTVLLTLVAGTLAFLLTAAVIEHWFVPGGFGFLTRTILFAVLVSGAGYYAVHRLWPLLVRPINPVYAAHTIEQGSPTLKNSLLNLLLFREQRDEITDAVYETLEEQAAQRLVRVPVEASVDRSYMLRLGYVVLAVVAACALYKVLSPKDPLVTASRVLMPWSDIVPASRVTISNVEPGAVTLARGSVLNVSAEVRGIGADDPVFVRYTTADGQAVNKPVQLAPTAAGLRFTGQLPAASPGVPTGVAQNLRYRIEAGDARSREYAVNVVAAPTITVERIDYDFPDYTGFADHSVSSLGDIRALEGTRVTIHARANELIDEASVDFEADGRRDIVMIIEGQEARTPFVLALRDDRETPKFTSYVLRFTTADGRKNSNPVKSSIEVLPDYEPEAAIVAPREKLRDVRLDETVAIEVEASDPDFALAEVRLEGDVAGRKVLDERLLTSEHTGRFAGRYLFTPREHRLQPGDIVHYRAIARDNRQPSINPTTSEPQALRITSPDPNRPQPPPDRVAQRDPREQPPQDEPRDGQQQPGESGGESGDPSDSANEGDQQGEPASAGGESGERPEQHPGEQQQQQREPSNDQSSQGESGGEQSSGGQSSAGEQGEQSGEGQQQPGGSEHGDQGGESAGGESTGGESAGDDSQQSSGNGQSGGQQQRDSQAAEGESGANGANGSRSEDASGGQRGGEARRENGQGREERRGDSESQPGEGDDAPPSEQSPVSPDGENDGEAFERIKKFLERDGQLKEQSEEKESAEDGGEDAPARSEGQQQRGADQQESGDGEQSQDSQGSPESQPDMKPGDQWQQRPSGQDQSGQQEPASGGRGKRENDSQGEQGGDRTGGGEEGAGQRAPREGTGSDGQNQSADEGAGESSERGTGQTSSGAGDDSTANERTGQHSDERGEGSSQREGQGEQAGGEGDPESGGQTGGEDAPARSEGEHREGSDPGEPASAGGESGDQSDPSQQKPSDDVPKEQSGDASDGSAMGDPSGTPQGAGAPRTTEGTAPEADAANLEYAQKQTDLVLEKLSEQQKRNQLDKRLLDELGWSPDDLRRFLDRWQQLKETARGDSPAADAARRELDDALRSLGLRRGELQQAAAPDDAVRDLRQGYRGSVPHEYQERLRAYNQGVSRARPESK